MGRCDYARCTERAEQTVVLPGRTVNVCHEHTRRLAIAHRQGMAIHLDPLYVPHPFTGGSRDDGRGDGSRGGQAKE